MSLCPMIDDVHDHLPSGISALPKMLVFLSERLQAWPKSPHFCPDVTAILLVVANASQVVPRDQVATLTDDDFDRLGRELIILQISCHLVFAVSKNERNPEND